MAAAQPEESLRSIATRWRRYGHDRLYVTDHAGVRLGYRDLTTGEDSPTLPEHAAALSSVAALWQSSQPTASHEPPQDERPKPDGPWLDLSLNAPGYAVDVRASCPRGRPWIDLSLNEPGAAVRELALAKRAEAPVKTTIARLLGVHTDERAWRIGADGEERVAKEIAKLAHRDPSWRAIHSIPVGKRGSDIDHLVLGPGGVFTINTKCHPDADIWVGGDTFLVNGHRQPYVRNARHESLRATRLLSEVTGIAVHVEALIVPVLCNVPLTIRAPPGDGVHVVARRQLKGWFGRLGSVLERERLDVIWEAARRSTTWTS